MSKELTDDAMAALETAIQRFIEEAVKGLPFVAGVNEVTADDDETFSVWLEIKGLSSGWYTVELAQLGEAFIRRAKS